MNFEFVISEELQIKTEDAECGILEPTRQGPCCRRSDGSARQDPG